MKRLIVFDIETIYHPNASEPQARDESGNLAFPAIFHCCPVSICSATFENGEPALFLKHIPVPQERPTDPVEAERVLVESFVDHWFGPDRGRSSNDTTLVSWNGRGFDVPVIAAAAMRHGIKLPYFRDRGFRYRYSEDGHVDLCDQLGDYGATRRPRLDQAAKAIGLPGKFGTDGSMVQSMYDEGKIAEIEEYCITDVFQTAALYFRWLYMTKRGTSLDDYRGWMDRLFMGLGFELSEKTNDKFISAMDRSALLLGDG